MTEVINLESFNIEDDGEEDKENQTIIDLDTFELRETPKPSFDVPVEEAVPPQSFEGRDASGMRRSPDVDKTEGAFGRNVKQGLINIGGGVLRYVGAGAGAMGVEGADRYLQDLEISQNMEQKKTAQISEGEPIKSFGGEVVGETLGFPVGGGGATLIPRLATGALSSGASAALSAGGRNEDASGIATETALGVLLDPIFQGIGAFRKMRKEAGQADDMAGVRAESDSLSNAAENVVEAADIQPETGIRLLPAQQTMDPFQLEQQAFIGQNFEASARAYKVLKEQNKEAATAVGDLLNMIASPLSPSTAPGQARRASGEILSTVKLMRSEAASPIYKQSFRRQRQGKTPPIDTSNLQIKAEKMAAQFDAEGEVSNNIKTLLGKISRANGDLSKLHNAKLEIDQMIEGTRESSVGNTTKRYLSDLQSDLVREMTDQSPSYRAARDEFRRLSPLVDEVRAGVFGRIADIDDKDLKRVSGIIFDASESNPEILANSIRTLTNIEGGSEIVAGLLRTEIEKRLGRMKSGVSELAEVGGRQAENVPANLLNALFGNSKQKGMLFSALRELDPQAEARAKWLEKALERSRQGRPGGSQTGIRNVINAKLNGVSLSIRNFFRNPIESVFGIGEDEMFSVRAAALGEALYNPDWSPDMKRIMKLNPNSQESASKFEVLLNKIVKANEISGTTRRVSTVAPRVALNEDDQENK